MRSFRNFALFALLGGVAAAAACGGEDLSTFNGGEDGGVDSGFPPPIGETDSGGGDGSTQGTVVISPKDAVIDVDDSKPLPTLQYTATVNGNPVAVAWAIDRGEVGAMAAASGLLSPNGTIGGKANVLASVGSKTVSTSVTIRIRSTQNGAAAAGDAGADSGGGAGGRGGVGGDPMGIAVDAATKAVLLGTPVADTGLKWLYPYDGTVWPRGLLAPQLQWEPGAQTDYDAVLIKITEANYEYQGFFKKNGARFINHPIPQNVWRSLAQSNTPGEDVTVSLTFAKGSVAYGPIVEKWKVASAPLKGIVYYNSYGTKLAKNYTGALGPDTNFGGATLGIRGGSTDPALVAGDSTAGGCRVCHSVSANGAALITQRAGGGQPFSAYALKTSTETTMADNGVVSTWPALYPDGSMFFSSGGGTPASKVFDTPSGAGLITPTQKTVTGLPADLRAETPAFSPDGKALAFNLYGGAGSDRKTLAMMTFDKTTMTFGAVTNLDTPASGNTAIWPSFMPNNAAIVYQVETRYNGRDFGGTRGGPGCEAVGGCGDNNDTGTRAELWWLDVKTKTRARLDKANGLGYLPTGPMVHNDDATLNYEPTVNPVPSGGYAWVVFTSRRLYGNIATINPWQSDPRFTDISSKPTTKKLWVAAVDLNGTPGTDPSHPAFYLPAQELLAGNARGFWVVDPCHNDGTSCETGDECCGGYCRPGTGGALVCSNTVPTCAQEFEKCTNDAECCGTSLSCINNRCAQRGPK
ncbi:MAG: hypothetical protein HOO96_11735 [Polyangiaceae bacterium]|nr:hypothetical protein [Polyangiaceae bacterium]